MKEDYDKYNIKLLNKIFIIIFIKKEFIYMIRIMIVLSIKNSLILLVQHKQGKIDEISTIKWCISHGNDAWIVINIFFYIF